jgi:L-ascorbate metabolism protein UlaG (beta-lactamase superfamily)
VPHPDVVLLSHDHHADNFDDSGRELASRVSSVFTTTEGAERLGPGAVGLADYESATVPLPDGGELTITGVPAHHGPDGLWQVVGPVIGFVLTGEGLPTVYVSGDNSSLDLVEEIEAKFGPIDLAVLFAGGAKFDEVMDGAFLTLTNEAVLEAAKIMDTATIIPIHADGWAHFSQNAHQLRDAFEAGGIGHRIVVVELGASAQLEF